MSDKIATLEQFLKEDPADTFSRYALALEYAKIEDVSKALFILGQLKTIDPDYLALYYQLGKLQQIAGLTNEAAETFREGILLAKKQNNRHTHAELKFALEDLTGEDED
jgi:tetratricopeptide (TPR) repeat protein